jgi:vacuolar protein-sorting-associated protein 4
MLKRGLKENANTISEEQLTQFAYKTEGYSGSDIANLIKDAVYEPIRKLQIAKKFRKVGNKLTPAEDSAMGPDIVETTLTNIPSEQLQIPAITAQDLEIATKKTKASVDKNQLKEYEQFTASFGQDG